MGFYIASSAIEANIFIIVMENALLNVLSSDSLIRVPAEQSLKASEESPGFLLELFRIYNDNPNYTLKLCALILAKSVIIRQWHIVGRDGKITPVPDEEKIKIKDFLYEKVLINREPHQKLLQQLVLCIESVSKFHFYDQWQNLLQYFPNKLNNLEFLDIYLLKVLVKTQIRRRTKLRQFKEWITGLYPGLKSACVLYENNIDLLKIILKCLTVIHDTEMIHSLLIKAKNYLSVRGGEENVRVLLKGLNLIENTAPEVFSGLILHAFIEVNCILLEELDVRKHDHLVLIRQAVYNIRQILGSNDDAVSIIESLSPSLLKKCFDAYKSEDYWEKWVNNEFIELFEVKRISESKYFNKLLPNLIQSYPLLLQEFEKLIQSLDTLDFPTLHSTLYIFSLLPKGLTSITNCNITLEILLKSISGLSFEGFQQKVIFRDILVLIKKWLKTTQNFSIAFSTILSIKSSKNSDIFLIYSSILTIKELLSYPVPEDVPIQILQAYGNDFIILLSSCSDPNIIWNLVSFFSALVSKCPSKKVPELLQIFTFFVLDKLWSSKIEIIVIAITEMLGKLLRIYADESSVIEAVGKFLKIQLKEKCSERVEFLWLLFIQTIEVEETIIVDGLLVYFKGLFERNKSLAVKILEEYKRLYQALDKNPENIAEIIRKS
ncbi:hypothetical protein SteCoe_8132 [Stentor coeruleus]|uniref:Importin N-terminal domain-containing protein n=1 Tax=Stentor coeruleus TaxID=5963 RepID=A0A1R2CL54_9CILI|nr:hypothetical protein SteCoe_8132 [Stentor coeruleus]